MCSPHPTDGSLYYPSASSPSDPGSRGGTKEGSRCLWSNGGLAQEVKAHFPPSVSKEPLSVCAVGEDDQFDLS